MRLLYFERNILHRGISYGNLLKIARCHGTAQRRKLLITVGVAHSVTLNFLVDFDQLEVKEDERRLESCIFCLFIEAMANRFSGIFMAPRHSSGLTIG